jgi:hypothetical protein
MANLALPFHCNPDLTLWKIYALVAKLNSVQIKTNCKTK